MLRYFRYVISFIFVLNVYALGVTLPQTAWQLDDAMTHAERGQYAKAIEKIKQLNLTGEDLGKAQYNLGIIYYDMERYDDAIKIFESAKGLISDTDRAALNYNLGNSYLRKGDIDAAISAYRAALASREDYEYAAINLDLAERISQPKTPSSNQQTPTSDTQPSSEPPAASEESDNTASENDTPDSSSDSTSSGQASDTTYSMDSDALLRIVDQKERDARDRYLRRTAAPRGNVENPY